MDKSSLYVRRITISAVFLCISLVLKTAFSFYLPIFGQNGMRLGISGIFSIMPSLLFGPVYGAITAGLNDLLGYLLKPTGAYLPLMTLVVTAGGFIRGALWSALCKKDSKVLRISITVISGLLLLAGICNIAFLAADGVNHEFYSLAQNETVNTDNMHLISKMLIAKTINTKDPSGNLATSITFMTKGMIGCSVFGLLLLIADLVISKKFLKGADKAQIPQLLIAMVVSGLIVTTLNTVILRETAFASWKALPFAVIWIPRVIEEILSNTVKAYFVAMLLGICRQHSLNELITAPLHKYKSN